MDNANPSSISVKPILNKFTVALCVLNQWALDFTGNADRIIQSIVKAKRQGAHYRIGPELELSGYGCEDHFNELDTFHHSLQCLAKIIKETAVNPECRDIVCDIGMPVLFSSVAYNCRVLLLNGKVLLIRPKMVLADGGLHRETRWFTAWPHRKCVVDFPLPPVVRQNVSNAQETVVFGDALLQFTKCHSADNSLVVGIEICEELWIGSPPHIEMFASGADVVLNSSASHHELGKMSRRIDLVRMASRANGGGLYAYTNLVGCDGGRVGYDGTAIAAMFGDLVCQTDSFPFKDVEVHTVTVHVDAIRARRINNKTFGRTAAAAMVTHGVTSCGGYPSVRVDFPACPEVNFPVDSASPMKATCSCLEEIARGPALWMWDVLRRSKSSGFFVALSGGLDSAAVACLVFSMCCLVCEEIRAGNQGVLKTCSRLLNCSDTEAGGLNPPKLCSHLLTTCYLPSENSSLETETRSARLGNAIGARHLKADISGAVRALIDSAVDGLQLSSRPKFAVVGGSPSENLALQNVQARARMVLSYLVAQLSDRPRLILGTGNLEETIRGYLTKYDCSSADINPIGSISKLDLRKFLADYCIPELAKHLPAAQSTAFCEILGKIIAARPTAELVPLAANGQVVQTDEADMGLTYAQLSLFCRIRKSECCGPYGLLQRLLDTNLWREFSDDDLPDGCRDASASPGPHLGRYLADKVRLFFTAYATNRHKSTVLPPTYHAVVYSADDNRFDLRPFLYPSDWTHQFACMEELVQQWNYRMGFNVAVGVKDPKSK